MTGLAEAAHVPPREAAARLDQAQARASEAYRTAAAKATAAAEATRKGVATASILGFIALLVGALVGWFGGGFGATRRSDHLSTGSRA